MENYKYKQVAKTIRQAIDAGEYPVGTPLPGERKLTQKHSCSRQTVRNAIRLLCKDGVLKQVHGSGNFVLAKTPGPKSGLVAVIATHIALPNFTNTLLSIEKTLLDGGYYPIIATTSNRFDLERKALDNLLGQTLDGLIVEGVQATIPNPNIHIYQKLVSQGLPVVFINSHYKEIEEAVWVSMDGIQGAELCGEYLISHGLTNFIGVFKADDEESVQRHGHLGRYLSERGFPWNDANLLWYTSGNLHKSLEDFALSRITHCNAAVCFNDEVAFVLHEILERNRIELPHDFEFVAFDKTVFFEQVPRKITTFEYPQETIGKLAAKKIMNMMQGKPETTYHLPYRPYQKR